MKVLSLLIACGVWISMTEAFAVHTPSSTSSIQGASQNVLFASSSMDGEPQKKAVAISGRILSSSMVAVVAGGTLAAQMAVGASYPNDQSFTSLHPTTSVILAGETLDFSLPSSYGTAATNQGGFGLGAEYYTGGSTNGDQKSLESVAMKKAEEARLARKKELKAQRNQQYEDQIRRDEEKKAENLRRIQGLFD